MAGDRVKVPQPILLLVNNCVSQRPAYFFIHKFFVMRHTEEKLETIVLSRPTRQLIESGIESIMMPWAYQPHPLQARYLAHLIWQFEGEYELDRVNTQLVAIMGHLMERCVQEHHEPRRITLQQMHLTLSNIYSLFQQMMDYPVLLRLTPEH